MNAVRKTILLVTLLLSPGAVQEAFSQERVTILNAQRAEGGTVNGEPVRKIIGDVRLQTNSTYMDADSVHQFETRNLMHAYNIQIESDEDIIWADTLYYNTQTGFSEFRGRVIILSERNTLFSESVDYDRTLDVAHFNTPVRFEDDRGVLVAREGYYYQPTDVASFRGDVQLSDSTQYLEADSLYMNREADFYRLFENVYAEDFEEKVTFTGSFLETDSTGRRLLTGDAWMMQINESGSDTSHVNSERIQVTETDSTDYMDAFLNVRIWSPSFAAVSDTAHYRSDLEQFRLLSNPIAWQNNIQLTGPYIEALLENDEVKFLTSYSNPIAVQQDSLTGRLNQMKGDTLNAYFTDGQIETIVVYENSEVIFHLLDENDEPDGLIELIASGASTLSFLNGELENFKAEQNIEGSHLSETPQNIERQLPGFRWDPEMKPDRPAIHTPRLPAISPDRPFTLPDRYLRYNAENNLEP